MIDRRQKRVKFRPDERKATASTPAGSLDDFRWLVSAEAAAWLELPSAAEPAVRLVDRLRRDLSIERTHLVLEQAELRRRARTKFAAAERMFFTPTGLEQATDELVAAYKAERIAGRIAVLNGGLPLADLCCGIGGDLISLAGVRATLGVERDPRVAILAEANLAVSAANAQFGSALAPAADKAAMAKSRVAVAEVNSCSIADCQAWHIDPDRRADGRRTTRVALHEPPPATIERLLAECPHGAVKLAPAAVLPDDWQSRSELEWISSRRECRQLVAWFGNLAGQPGTGRSGKRRATVISASRNRRSFTGEPDVPLLVAATIGRYVFEPDPAILAAGLCGALAAELGLEAIAPQSAYLTGEPREEMLRDAAVASFAVIDVLPLQIKPLREWLRARSIGLVEVKKRGIEIDPQRLAAQLRGPGDDRAILLAARLNGKATAIIARRQSDATG